MLRQIVRVSLIAFLLLLLSAPPSEGRGGHGGHRGGHHHAHHGHHHGHRFHGGTSFFVGVGPWWWGPPHPWWYYDPYWYYGPYSYYRPPRVIVEQPPIYIEQGEPSAPLGYWYYCASAQRYYPDVATCPEAWIRVP